MSISTYPQNFNTQGAKVANLTASKLVLDTLSLLTLPKHKLAYIETIEPNPAFGAQDGMVSKRLHDLGFLPNTAIKIVAKGLFGRPPFAVQLAGGAQFSLRRDELAKIHCRLV